MSFAWSRRAALGSLLFAGGCIAGGCKGSDAAATPPAPTADAGKDAAAAALSFEVDPGLACGGGTSICVAPSQTVTFRIDGGTDGAVNLSLEGAYADAALTADQVTLSGGHAQVTLETASVPVTFTVVARQRGAASAPSASLSVTVSKPGTATIEAMPSYVGHRPTPQLFATGFELSTCAKLPTRIPNPLTDPQIAWTSAPDGVAIALSVHAGERIAVEVRVGHYAVGCADVDPLAPDESRTVPVQVYDVPMALAATNLDATFSFAADAAASTGWKDTAQAAATRVQGAFFATAGAQGPPLLDAMRALVPPTSQAQFDTLRAQGGWDGLATGWLASHAPSIQARAGAWLGAAADDGMGPLVVHVDHGSSDGKTAPVTATTFGALSAARAGIQPPSPFQWTADPNDTVHLSGAIDLASTPLVAHEADAHAAASVAKATDVPSAIAIGIDCSGLATSIVGSGVSYGTCDAACTATTCAAALSAAWAAASSSIAGGGDMVHTTLTASAPADVGDMAEPQYIEGGWLGQVSGAGVPAPKGFPITGTVIAIEPMP